MLLDLAMIADLCREVGLRSTRRSADEVAVQLESEVTLLFQNVPQDDDCLIGFEGTQWHTHDGLTCANQHGCYVELTYLDVVSGLANGTVLICELRTRGELTDRWLVHRDFVDEFRFLQDGEEIRIRPVSKQASAAETRQQ